MATTDTTLWTNGSLVELPRDECERLLGSHAVGRVAWNGAASPHVLPVNFAVVDDEIWFRTTAHSSLSKEIDDLPVTFQVDDVDEFTRSGWSVLVRGTAHVVYDATRVPRTWPGLETWPAGAHALHVVIEPTAITGRRLLAS
ncbi:pyridoxamine 5'-phosphate oxidase family protein [Nocardioides sp. URHA0020]|uniref:pyridoxamine 5'-phosphate oxidase family protein n=1 Tax=Nocardioides sp. URHA0020 TaxID=1380392 RepID=UPI0006871AA8|nr:pyridoxamine 5'-phosphate oxidase family protein [Nocardioides sp. URHA0020]